MIAVNVDALVTVPGFGRIGLGTATVRNAGAITVMLTPSTADTRNNDPTVKRCERRARADGFGRMWVGNIFALRSTDSRQIYDHGDPAGPDNDATIMAMVSQADAIFCGWGDPGQFMGRGQQVMAVLASVGYTTQALRLTRAGQPGHPLYIGYAIRPQPLDELIVSG